VPVVIRPLAPADVEPARAVGRRALDGVSRRLDAQPDLPPDDEAGRARMRTRIERCAATDPDGAWVAADEATGEVVGVALALRREGLWVLSLLAVAEGLQGQGVGARLLDASLRTAAGATGGLILVSRDPRAMRRYQLAGFRLQPAYEATGRVDRSRLPAGLGARDGDLSRDGQLCADVGRELRGAAHGPDLPAMLAAGAALLVAEDGRDRGFAVRNGGRVWLAGATSDALAARLLWAALAAGGPEVEAEAQWLTARQQWALDVLLDARLSLRLGSSVATRGEVGPMTPYLPSGAYG